MSQSKLFHERVRKCNHKNLSEVYWVTFFCPTPYCSGHESFCLDCLAFISTCGCGFNNEISGWPRERRLRAERRKARAAMEEMK